MKKQFDTVISNGRVIDPETRLDAIRHVGIDGETIRAVSDTPLAGRTVIDASGLVVAPGYIDMHSHAQSIPSDRIQAFDGVTTALELESGMMPIGTWYDAQAETGRPLNYGASAAWTFARIAELNPEMGEPDGTLEYFQKAFALKQWSQNVTTQAQADAIVGRLEQGLKEGAIGIGINYGYAPAAGVQEITEVSALAARYGVPTYTHIAFSSNVDPESSFEGYIRIIGFAAATGAHMHICHLNSTSLRDLRRCVEAVKTAQAAGLNITVEAYPYGAASTAIGAAFFLDPAWRERTGSDWSDIVVNATGEAVATKARLRELQEKDPGEIVVYHFLHSETDPYEEALLDLANLYPNGAVASDTMPWTMPDGSFLVDNVWPLPDGAVSHPRSAATFSRFISRYVKKMNKLSLLEAVERCSLTPATILGESTPALKRKGRLRVGADADVIVFDLDEVEDKATYQNPTTPSSGMQYVLVNGVPLIANGELQVKALPGKPVRRAL